MTVNDFINVLSGSIGMEWLPDSHDVLLEGDGDSQITNIAVTMTATFDVLEKAVDTGCNLIVTHEPLFYEHSNRTETFLQDPVFRKKREFVRKHSLNVFRFHDHMHRTPTDMIAAGMAKALGWENHARDAGMKEFSFDDMSLSDLAGELEKKLQSRTVRFVGNPGMKAGTVLTSWGFAGRDACIALINGKSDCILIVGETHEWEFAEYVRDAVHSGERKGLIVTGHISSEERGMSVFADRLQTLLPGRTVRFFEAGNPFKRR